VHLAQTHIAPHSFCEIGLYGAAIAVDIECGGKNRDRRDNDNDNHRDGNSDMSHKSLPPTKSALVKEGGPSGSRASVVGFTD